MTVASKQVVSYRIQAQRKGSILELFRVARIFTCPGFDCAIVLVSSAHNLFLIVAQFYLVLFPILGFGCI